MRSPSLNHQCLLHKPTLEEEIQWIDAQGQWRPKKRSVTSNPLLGICIREVVTHHKMCWYTTLHGLHALVYNNLCSPHQLKEYVIPFSCELQGVKMEVNKEKILLFLQLFFDKGGNVSQVTEIANGADTVTTNYVQFWFHRFGSDNLVALHCKYDCWYMTATAGSDVVQSGRLIFDDFFQYLWPYIGNNTANVVFQMVKRLWLIRIDQ
ncbi:adhesion G protein-coupled receptor B2 [Trichonephila clavipes]|nr:adhesion G protein-coupled receptor B2 [Trichonephila clavipes]